MLSININKLTKLENQVNEAYKRLRTNVQLCGSDIKVIAITSNIPNEGKSSVAFNLAISMAEAGKKVMFMDCDLRKSVLIGRYKIKDAIKGLTHYLSGLNEYDEVACETNVPNLHVVFSGPVPPNPAELLGGNKFRRLLENLRENYDYIILDTPPVGSVIDGVIVAEQCDGAIMVVSHGTISVKLAQNTKAQLDKCNCKILGAVLNKVPIVGNGYYGKYYGRYYGKYYGKYYGRYYGKYYGNYGNYGYGEDD